MSEAWRAYRGAPDAGAPLCRLDEVPDPGTRSLDVAGFPVLVIRSGGLLRAFVNACPHQYLPLDHRGDRLISADGATVRCTNHGAGFRIEDGAGTEGFGLGCALDRIPVTVDDEGRIRIA